MMTTTTMTKPVAITAHAVDRYIERWRPTASREQAEQELRQLVVDSTLNAHEWQPYGLQCTFAARLGDRWVGLVLVMVGVVAWKQTFEMRTVLPDLEVS